MPTSAQRSKVLYHDIDLKKNKIENARLQPVTTAERTAMTSSLNSNDIGLLVYDTTLKLLFDWDGNQWKSVGLDAANTTKLTEAYNNIIRSVGVTTTPVDQTITLTTESGSTITTTFNTSYIHTQTIAANQWIVNHNLNKYPKVTIVNDINVEVIGDIVYTNTNQVIISFSIPFVGKAFFT